MRTRPIVASLLAALALLTPGTRASLAAAGPEPYLRVHEDEVTGASSLQIALRSFRRSPTEPAVTLVGVAHVGDTAYYDALQRRLDAHDLVLFEGVGPIWARLPEDATDRDRVNATKARLHALRGALAGAATERGAPPATLEDLLDGIPGYDARLLRAATTDAWGNPIGYTPDPLRLVSLGADGEPGGRGVDADLSLDDLPEIDPDAAPEGEGIQATLAGAAGLVFQLDAIDYDREGWVNSDTTAEALSFAMAGLDPEDARPAAPGAGGGGEPDPLFQFMGGQGPLGKLTGGLLKMMGASPRSQAMLRLMLIETLAQAESMMEAMDSGDAGDGASGPAAGLGRMMELLISQRNEVVLDDLDASIDALKRAGNDEGSIAVFYGAGHLAEMEASLIERGFEPAETVWLDAIAVDPADTGMSPEQARAMRSMLSSMIAAQTRALDQGRGQTPDKAEPGDD